MSDCTAEGIKATLCLHSLGLATDINEERLKDAVNVILSLHNVDGGWATYENQRGPASLEVLNPSETFGSL